MRKLGFVAIATVSLGFAFTACSSEYSREETIDNLTEAPPDGAGLTEEQATCVVDTLEDEVGTEELDKAVNQDSEDLSPEIQEALTNAVSECVFTP